MPARILQLTDLHLMATQEARLKDVPTRNAFLDILQFLDSQPDDADRNFDRIVISGDLAHDEKRETYQDLRELLGHRAERCLFLPGNHDNRQWIREVFAAVDAPDGPHLTFSVEIDGWRLIGLDSHLEGEVNGHVDEQQILWFESQLRQHTRQPTILFLHHPPFLIHSAWLDQLGLRDPDALMRVVAAYPHVRVVSAGHVHQEFDVQRDGIRLLTTPSTAVQFTPRRDEPDYEHIPPGYRIFSLNGDRCETRVVRLPTLKYPPCTA